MKISDRSIIYYEMRCDIILMYSAEGDYSFLPFTLKSEYKNNMH